MIVASKWRTVTELRHFVEWFDVDSIKPRRAVHRGEFVRFVDPKPKFRPIERRCSRRRAIHAGYDTEAARAEDATNFCERSYRIAPKVYDVDGKRSVKSCVAEGHLLRRSKVKGCPASIDQRLVKCGGLGHHRLGDFNTGVSQRVSLLDQQRRGVP